MITYVLYESREESSLTLFPLESIDKINLTSDAIEIWRTEAPTYEIACLRRNHHLGWEPYKPSIVDDADLLQYVPKDKHDLETAQLLINLRFPVIRPVLWQLFEWIQDVNWPVARILLPFLCSLGRHSIETVRRIFKST